MRIGSRPLSFALVSTLALGATVLGCIEPAVQGEGAGKHHVPDPNNPAHHEVPTVGTTKAGLEVVDDAIAAWMRATCAGGVAVSLGFGEEPLLARGYGKLEGPPNIICQDKNGDDTYQELNKVRANTPFRIGSNSKAITAAIVRDVLKKRLAEKGRPATDDELESLKIFDLDMDLVSPRLRRFVNGNLATSAVACESPAEQPNGQPVVSGGRVDPRWLDITVGQLLSHRSGLPSDGNSTYRKLGQLRGLTTAEALDAAEAQSGAPEAAKAALRDKLLGARFVAPQTIEEYLIANTDLCFEFEPGTAPPPDENDYSNLGFGILQHIAEHVSGMAFAPALGWHDLHSATLLAKFAKEKLGFEKGVESSYGIYFSQPVEGQRDPAEPVYRAWDGTSMLGRSKDIKRPHCYFGLESKSVKCDVFLQGFSRFDWGWEEKLVNVSYEKQGVTPGAGLLAAEMPLYQKFMARYWVSGDEKYNYYGRERATNPSPKTRVHHGALAGTKSTVVQFMGDDIPYYVVPRKDGELDLANLTESTTEKSCKIPSGLNLAMATNQSSDSACGADGCGMRYRALREVVKEALCQVDWLKVSPQITNK